MSRLDQPLGGFGGPRVVKPQANVYTVLLAAAVLFVAAALGLELWRFNQLREKPTGGPGMAPPPVVQPVAPPMAPPVAAPVVPPTPAAATPPASPRTP